MGFFKVVLTMISIVYLWQNTADFIRLRKTPKD